MSLLVCDDSNMARSVPTDSDVDITFASNGVEGLWAIRAGRADVTLLDLTVPKMDGYNVLEHIDKEGLHIMMVVISVDIQREACERVKGLGAIEFIKKPIDKEKLMEVLNIYGLHQR